MSTAELNRKKLDLIAWINNLTDEHLIDILDDLKKSKTKKDDWWNELSEIQKKIVENGLKDIEQGDLISSSEFWNKLKSA